MGGLFAMQLLRSAGSVFGDHRPPAPAQIDAASDDALALANVDIVAEGACPIEERERARPEVVVVVFDKPGQIVGEGVFTTNANGPSAAGLARRVDERRR